MLTTAELLAAAKAAQGNCSSYRLARLCDVPERTMARWTSGKNYPDDTNAVRLAELAGLDPSEVLAAINAERASEPHVRALWEGMAKRLHHAAAVTLTVILSLWISGGPDGAAMASTPLQSIDCGPVNSHGNGSIHWRVFVRTAVRRLGRWLAGLIPGPGLQGFAV